MNPFKHILVAVIFLVFSSSLFASDLVNIQWLKDNSQTIKLIDLRSVEQFQSGHIPHALNIPYSNFMRKKNNIDGFVETPIAFKSVMENYGIKNSDTIVLYSDFSFLDSMRIYWVMDFYGHKQIKVLDGGIQSWINEQFELSISEVKVVRSEYFIEANSQIITTKFRTFMASKNSNYVLVDGRSNSEYQGDESLTKRKGHIPNAINIPWVELVKNRSVSQKYERIKMPSTLQDMNFLKEKLSIILKDKNIILYCNGGQESSILYFALKELGRKAAVYDGSWFEWSNDDNMPIEANTSNL